MKCLYCGTESEEQFCTEEHRIEGMKYQEYMEKNAKWFLAGLIIPTFLTIPAIVFDYFFIILGLLLMIFGATLVVFPFPTPETTRKLGLIKSIRILKLSGLGTILIGVISIVIYTL